ncbi:MAG: hypothetical protein U1F30_02540 [Steroidobacteraceae bacterium]
MSNPPGYPIGHTLSFQVGPMTIEHEILSESRFNARHVAGPMAGTAETMSYSAALLRPGLFLVAWQEADQSTVVHIEDFESGTVRVALTTTERTFMQFAGTMKRVA